MKLERPAKSELERHPSFQSLEGSFPGEHLIKRVGGFFPAGLDGSELCLP